MRSKGIHISARITFPCGQPDGNGVVYTKEAAMRAVNQMSAGVPIHIINQNGGIETAGLTESAPYAVQTDDDGNVMFSVDGWIYGGTLDEGVIIDDNCVVKDFSIAGIGFCK